jgi:hypothetical protein
VSIKKYVKLTTLLSLLAAAQISFAACDKTDISNEGAILLRAATISGDGAMVGRLLTNKCINMSGLIKDGFKNPAALLAPNAETFNQYAAHGFQYDKKEFAFKQIIGFKGSLQIDAATKGIITTAAAKYNESAEGILAKIKDEQTINKNRELLLLAFMDSFSYFELEMVDAEKNNIAHYAVQLATPKIVDKINAKNSSLLKAKNSYGIRPLDLIGACKESKNMTSIGVKDISSKAVFDGFTSMSLSPLQSMYLVGVNAKNFTGVELSVADASVVDKLKKESPQGFEAFKKSYNQSKLCDRPV